MNKENMNNKIDIDKLKKAILYLHNVAVAMEKSEGKKAILDTLQELENLFFEELKKNKEPITDSKSI